MVCCLTFGALLAVFRRTWLLLTGRRPERVARFAPVAYRPAPGEPMPAMCPQEALPAAIPLMRWAAAGVVLYLVAVGVLLWLEVAGSEASAAVWVLRTALYLAVLLLALRLARSSIPRERLAPWALITVGLVCFELGILDMHLFALLEIGSPLGDLAFHGLPVAAALAGAILLPSRPTHQPLPAKG